MARSRWWVAAFFLTASLFLNGCGAGARSKATPADLAATEAMSALMGYLEGRRGGDLPRAYSFLSGAAKELYTEQEFITHYGQFPRLEWQRVGRVNLVAEDWARVVVYDITSLHATGQRSRLADFAYYMQRIDGRWGVAVVNPAMAKLQDHEGAESMLEAARPLMQTNPYSAQIHRELYYAFLASGDPAQAEAELTTLFKVSSPSDLASLQLMWSQFHLLTDRPDKAIEAARSAWTLAEAYPETYGNPWRSSSLTILAQAHLVLDQVAPARTALQQAVELDPENLDARAMLEELDRPKA